MRQHYGHEEEAVDSLLYGGKLLCRRGLYHGRYNSGRVLNRAAEFVIISEHPVKMRQSVQGKL